LLSFIDGAINKRKVFRRKNVSTLNLNPGKHTSADCISRAELGVNINEMHSHNSALSPKNGRGNAIKNITAVPGQNESVVSHDIQKPLGSGNKNGVYHSNDDTV